MRVRDTTGTNGSSTVVVGCAHVVRREYEYVVTYECMCMYVHRYTPNDSFFLNAWRMCVCVQLHRYKM